MATTTITNISYTGSTAIATVEGSYGIPVVAHIWGGGGGGSPLYPGAGGGYSRVKFVAKPGDQLRISVGQGGGAGGENAALPPPPATWSTRSTPNIGPLPVYPTTAQNYSELLANYGVWGNPQQLGGTVDGRWSIQIPVAGYYFLQGSCTGVGYAGEPDGDLAGGYIYIDNTPAMFLPGDSKGQTLTQRRYFTAGTHTIIVQAVIANNTNGQLSGVAFAIEQEDTNGKAFAPAGLPGASYIGYWFNTRYPPPGQDAAVAPVGIGSSTFLDTWGVWNRNPNDLNFTRTYTLYFGITSSVTFQMASSMTAECLVDGNIVLTSTNVSGEVRTSVNITPGNHTITIRGTGSQAVSNRIGLIFGTSDDTAYSGGWGGTTNYPPRDPNYPSWSYQGTAGGGGGATILSLNGLVIGTAAGGGGAAGYAPTNVSYVTTTYTGSLSTQPFDIPQCPATTITPGTSGYYIGGTVYYDGATEGQQGIFNPSSWCVIVNGTIVYGPSGTPPPQTFAKQTQFVGWSCYDAYSVAFPAVQCWNFQYISLNTSGITDRKFNGQNGQTVSAIGVLSQAAGGGGGGGGGARGGNGGVGRIPANEPGAGSNAVGGYSGYSGMSLGDIFQDATASVPYKNEFYPTGSIAGFNFDTATATPNNGSRLPYRNSSPATWFPWMFQHAVCFSANPIEYSVFFPSSGTYTFNAGADYGMTVRVDGVVVAQLTDYSGSYASPSPRQFPVPVTAGVHTISIAWSDDGGTAGFALTIAIPDGVGIAQGGNAGTQGVVTNGGNGFVALEFQTGGGAIVKDNGEWKGVQTVYVKDNGDWEQVQATYINVDGIWKPIKGAPVPAFTLLNGNFGTIPRPLTNNIFQPSPPPPAPDYGYSGFTGWGNGDMF